MRQAGWRLAVKRIVDVSVAATGLVLAAPVIAATAVAVGATMGRPVLFRQQRPGYRGKPIHILKFRTMRDARDSRGVPLPDADRLTRVGQFLRATSLDELPQLVNVLAGSMSLVGPRPLLMQYLDRYSPDQARRHDVLPGITGWSQINGRNNLRWKDKLAFDTWYVDHWSLALDLKILALTLGRVSRRSGISQDGHVTMPEFMGD